MLDRVFGLTLRDLSTYVLIAAVVALPLQTAYSFAFRDVIEVHDIHPEIADLREGLQVRGVSAADIDTHRRIGWLVLALEVLLIPAIVGATRNALDARERGELASVKSAWTGAIGRIEGSLAGLRRPGVTLTGAGVAIAIGGLAQLVGSLLVEPLPDRYAWAGLGLATAAARSLAAPFVTVPLAWLARRG